MAEEASSIRAGGEGRRLWKTFLRNRAAVFGLVLAVVVTILSVAAPLLTSYDPLIQEARSRLQPPNQTHLLGRDPFGRDVFSRVLYAGRISLLVGVCSVLLG
ncbi:MAG TPA: ABC transporter permease, partial [Candidatus Methylomirabilis sp.]|nr:ABC transporter permease [Candidatus Methylomirabilis sp.]